MEKADALNKMHELEEWFNTLLPTIVDAKKALEIGISMESNRVAIDKEHKIVLDDLLKDKEKLKKLQDKVSKCEGELKARIEADDISFKQASDKYMEENKEIMAEIYRNESKAKSKHEENKKKYDAEIRARETTMKRLEIRIVELNKLRETAKKLALAE